MILKKLLGSEIVGQFHGPEAARQAESHFQEVFQKRGVPQEAEEYAAKGDYVGDGIYRLDITAALLEKGLVKSRGEVKRLLAQGAIEVNGKRIDSIVIEVPSGSIIQVGKRRFLKISITKTAA
jgi:tyrosyl-tRNA synthetase